MAQEVNANALDDHTWFGSSLSFVCGGRVTSKIAIAANGWFEPRADYLPGRFLLAQQFGCEFRTQPTVALQLRKRFSDRGIVKDVGFVVRRGLGSLRSQAMLLHNGVRG